MVHTHLPIRVRDLTAPSINPLSAGIVVKLYISSDNGTTWLDANSPTGPVILAGTPVLLKYVVNNTGNSTLTNVSLPKHLQTLLHL